MEGGRSLEINVISAKDIKHMKGFSKMKVYVVVYLKERHKKEKHQKVKTPVDREGGVNPTWNFPVKLRVAESLAQQNELYVVFKLKRDGTVVDRVAGKVKVPIRELLAKPPSSFLSYQVWTKSGKPKGTLNISYKFTDEIQATSSIPEEEEEQPPSPQPPVGPSSSLSAPPLPPDPDNRRRRRRRPRLRLPSFLQLGLLIEDFFSDDETYDDDYDAGGFSDEGDF